MTKATALKSTRATAGLDAATVAEHCRVLRMPTVSAQFVRLAQDAAQTNQTHTSYLAVLLGALGVFGYSFLEENMDKVKGASVNGVRPTAGAISDGSYPLARSLYIYVKKSNIGVTQGLQEFVNEFVSDAATGRGGYLQGRGLIPLPAGAHEANKGVAKALPSMGRPAT